MSALRTLRVGAPTRRIGVSPVSDLARRRASLPTNAGWVAQVPNRRQSRNWPETGVWETKDESSERYYRNHLKKKVKQQTAGAYHLANTREVLASKGIQGQSVPLEILLFL